MRQTELLKHLATIQTRVKITSTLKVLKHRSLLTPLQETMMSQTFVTIQIYDMLLSQPHLQKQSFQPIKTMVLFKTKPSLAMVNTINGITLIQTPHTLTHESRAKIINYQDGTEQKAINTHVSSFFQFFHLFFFQPLLGYNSR